MPHSGLEGEAGDMCLTVGGKERLVTCASQWVGRRGWCRVPHSGLEGEAGDMCLTVGWKERLVSCASQWVGSRSWYILCIKGLGK